MTSNRVSAKTKILLADDHSIVLEGLVGLLSGRYDVVGAVSDGLAVVEEARAKCPDVIVLDISMPRLNGLEAARIVHSQMPQTKIIFLTMHADRYFIIEAFRTGASGYLLKQSAGEELFTAIDEVMSGRRYLSALATHDTLSYIFENMSETETRITPRQRDVLQLIAKGKQMKEIASILNISSRTAESHKYEMMRTLHISTNAELIRYAIRIGLVTI